MVKIWLDQAPGQIFLQLCLFGIVSTTTFSSIENARSVFPHDFVRLKCEKSSQPKLVRDTCTWTFITENSTESQTEVTRECAFASRENVTKGVAYIYEGYVEIPDNADAVLCEGNDVERLSVQRVDLASPVSLFDSSSHQGPTIVLQRFSEDYSVRFGAHDVTNKDIEVNGQEVDGIKLFCIHNGNVAWTNYSEWRRRVTNELSFRDRLWLRSVSSNVEKWKAYLDFLLELEQESFTVSDRQVKGNQIQIVPLTIRNVTNSSSRRYECGGLMKSDSSSYVNINVAKSRIGPDEIILIQQIIAILDSLAQGKGVGNEQWYTLASLLSIILIIFLYYCKKKLDQKDPHQPTSPNKPPDEEVEMHESLQQTQSQQRLQRSNQSLQSGEEEPPVILREHREK